MAQEKQEIKPYETELLPYDPILLVLGAAKQWLLIAVVSVICGMAAYVFSSSLYVPVYQTQTTMVLTNRDSASSVYTNLDSTTRLAGVFTEVLNSSVMRNRILDELEMESFDGSIHASAIEETNLLTLQVRAYDPRTAFLVTKALVENHEIVTYQVMGDIVLEVLEPPTVPTRPMNAVNATSSMVKAMILSAAAVFVMLVALGYFRDTVRSRSEAERKLDCWCLGEIQHEHKRRNLKELLARRKKSILITDPQTGFRYVTTLNKLRRRVEQHLRGGKVLMVTSVCENEGKSTVASNLALAMAKKYKKVLLIDCDLRKPACHKILHLGDLRYSTADVIRGSVALHDAVVLEKRGNLDVLPAKRQSARDAAALIASEGIRLMLEQARSRYDFVVIDLPPMAVAPDSESMTEYVDGSLLVVRQNVAATTDLNRAINDLQRGKAKLLGCVLNNVISVGGGGAGGLGMGYGRYGRYGRYGNYGRYGGYDGQNTGK